MKLKAGWRNDCQGKRDRDCAVVSLSTRGWPPNYQVNRKFSATASFGFDHDGDRYTVFASQDFEGNTRAEVERAAEAWSQLVFGRIVAAIKQEFKAP